MAVEAGFEVNSSGIALVLRSPDGMVGRHLWTQAQAVAAASRAICPRSSRSGGGPHLADTIEPIKPIPDGAGLVCRVVATAPHAIFVHEGTRPHEIRPRNARVLAFQVGGETVFAKRVSHPGTKGTKFLTSVLYLAVA